MAELHQGSRERLDWVNTISLADVHLGIAGGFQQADHDGRSRLARLQAGDRIVFYSPRSDHPDGRSVRQFTAWGVVAEGEPYQVALAPGHSVWRRPVSFEPCLPVDVHTLLDRLGFIPNPRYWGMPFRRGLFTIPSADFEVIVAAMGAGRLRGPLAAA
jgi:hypothetical protein